MIVYEHIIFTIRVKPVFRYDHVNYAPPNQADAGSKGESLWSDPVYFASVIRAAA